MLSQVHSFRKRKRLFPSSSSYAHRHYSQYFFSAHAPFFFPVLQVPHQTELQVGFGIFHPISECSECLCIPSRSHSSASVSCRLSFYVQVFSWALVHPCWPPAAFASLPAEPGEPLLSLEEVILDKQRALLDTCFLHGCVPWDSSKQVSWTGQILFSWSPEICYAVVLKSIWHATKELPLISLQLKVSRLWSLRLLCIVNQCVWSMFPI